MQQRHLVWPHRLKNLGTFPDRRAMFNRKRNPSTVSSDAQRSEPLPPAVPHGDFPPIFRGVREYVEATSNSVVMGWRMFVVAVACVLLGICGLGMSWHAMTHQRVIPVLVEVNAEQGVVNRPVRIDVINASQSVVKAELAKWLTWAMTIDPKLTPSYLRLANARTRDRAVEQFRAFRGEQRVIEKVTRDALTSDIRTPTIKSVDTSQRGIAFAFVETTDVSTTGVTRRKSWRVRLDYSLDPPTKEADIYENPLGISITMFNPSEES